MGAKFFLALFLTIALAVSLVDSLSLPKIVEPESHPNSINKAQLMTESQEVGRGKRSPDIGIQTHNVDTMTNVEHNHYYGFQGPQQQRPFHQLRVTKTKGISQTMRDEVLGIVRNAL